ncbi:membrane-associated Zn-dependent proteases domain protein, partial [Chlamydia psittaci 84-8471/1]
EARTFCV